MKLMEIDIKSIKLNGNTRSSMDKKALQELANSIKENGLIQPIEVRKEADKFILVVGHRRLEAVKMNGEKTITAVVSALDEGEALNHQIVENLQRQDIPPMDEAKAYKKALDQKDVDVKELSIMIGKSKRYILERLQLNNLIGKWQSFLEKDVIKLSVALEVCKQIPSVQKDLFEYVGDDYNNFSAEDVIDYVNHSVLHSLTAVNFDIKDEELVKKAGSCLNCTKRTGACQELFPGLNKEDNCLDPECMAIKVKADIERKYLRIKDEGKEVVYLSGAYNIPAIYSDFKIEPADKYVEAKKEHKDIEPVMGVIIGGANAGKVIKLIPKSRLPKAKAGKTESMDIPDAKKKSPDERYERKLELISFPEKEEVVRVLLPLTAKVKTLDEEAMRLIAYSISGHADHQRRSAYYDYMGLPNKEPYQNNLDKLIQKLNMEGLIGFLISFAIGSQLPIDNEQLASSEWLQRLIHYNETIGTDLLKIYAKISPPYDEKRKQAKDKFVEKNSREPKIKII